MNFKVRFWGHDDYAPRKVELMAFLFSVCDCVTIESHAITDDASFLD